MSDIVLKNKPLVEAIFELRWKLRKIAPGTRADPHYQLLIGRLYDRLGDEYPFHEQLPAASFPDDIANYLVRHRFRKAENDWPLIQLGPGILTVNDTDGYEWSDFGCRINRAIKALFEVYPDSQKGLPLARCELRYIDAVAFDFESQDVFDFLENQLKTTVRPHSPLFADTGVSDTPRALDLRFSFSSSTPPGSVRLRFARGMRGEEGALIWETVVVVEGEDAPTSCSGISDWVKDAHNLTHDWFFKLIDGDLRRRFE